MHCPLKITCLNLQISTLIAYLPDSQPSLRILRISVRQATQNVARLFERTAGTNPIFLSHEGGTKLEQYLGPLALRADLCGLGRHKLLPESCRPLVIVHGLTDFSLGGEDVTRLQKVLRPFGDP